MKKKKLKKAKPLSGPTKAEMGEGLTVLAATPSTDFGYGDKAVLPQQFADILELHRLTAGKV